MNPRLMVMADSNGVLLRGHTEKRAFPTTVPLAGSGVVYE
jgi:hypothetical protein